MSEVTNFEQFETRRFERVAMLVFYFEGGGLA